MVTYEDTSPPTGSDPVWTNWEEGFDVEEQEWIREDKRPVTQSERMGGDESNNGAATIYELTDERKKKLQSMIKLGDDLTDEQKEKFFAVVFKNHKAFAVEDDELGFFTGEEASIDTGDAKPIMLPLRRFRFNKREEIEKTIEKLRRMNIIRPSKSPWASAVVPVRKPDGSLHICFDYRQLNTVVVDDVHPLPRLDDLIERCGRVGKNEEPCEYFSDLDMKMGYFQIKIRENDGSVEKTAFRTHNGLWESIQLPMGLKTSGAIYQQMMNNLLGDLTEEGVWAYINDVCIGSTTFDEQLRLLDEILGRFIERNLKVRPDKCNFLKKEVTFLGHLVSKDGVRPNPKRIEGAINFLEPKSAKETRSFYGLASFFRKFIADFDKISAPLTKVMSVKST